MNANDWAQIVLAVFRFVLAVATVVFAGVALPWLRKEGLPWLKEHRLYSLVRRLVQAAEKMYEYDECASNAKHDYVVNVLKSKGIEVTSEIEAYIDSAIEELDIAWMMACSGVTEVFDEYEDDDENPDAPEDDGTVEADMDVGEPSDD